MDRLRRAKSIAAFRAVIRHRKVSRPKAGVPPEGPGSNFAAYHVFSPRPTFKRSRHRRNVPLSTRDRSAPAESATTKIVVAEDAGRFDSKTSACKAVGVSQLSVRVKLRCGVGAMAKLIWRVKLIAELGSSVVSETGVKEIERDDCAAPEISA